jgi:hypothetical protein
MRRSKVRHLALLATLATVTSIMATSGVAGGQTEKKPRTVLYLWAGDAGQGPVLSNGKDYSTPDNPDFLAVMDADADSPTYGKILKTISVPTGGPGNEPHHMQPYTPAGCHTVFAGGLFSDFWYQFDISDALNPHRTGTITPAATMGTVPDAAFVLPNCEALGTEMGGDPSTGSYIGGPHGTVIRMNPDGTMVLETQVSDRAQDKGCQEQWVPSGTSGKPGGDFKRKTSVNDCLPSNPHGIWGRPDLNELVTSDFATPGRLIQAEAPTADVAKLTVRHYHLDPACTGKQPSPGGADCIKEPRVVLLPDGPREEANEGHKENVGVMETGLTNPPGELNPEGKSPDGYLPSKGGFATTMCGGALFYTPDVTAEKPSWKEVYDFTHAGQVAEPGLPSTAGCSGGGGVTVTPDNRFVVHTIIGREPGQAGNFIASSTNPSGFPGLVVKLDAHKLIEAGTNASCSIDTVEEVWQGGKDADCPTLAAVHVVDDKSTGGPHFFSYDYGNGTKRLAFFNYFVSETGVGGDLRVCMLNTSDLSPDRRFPAAVDGQNPGGGCIAFRRLNWPGDRGPNAGPAKPHYGLFANV